VRIPDDADQRSGLKPIPTRRPANLAGPNSSAMRVRFRGYVFFTSFEKFCIRHYNKFVAEQGIALFS
jgi:hypothetical protein